MNVQTLFTTLRFVDNLDRELQLQRNLEAIRDNLNNLAGQPSNPQFQSSLATALQAFSASTRKLADSITPAQMGLIAATGGEAFFAPSIATTIQDTVSHNAMTPTVARDVVQKLATERATYLQNVVKTYEGLQSLGVRGAELEAGAAEMAFLIPRELFKNHLGPLAKELAFIDKLIRDCSEMLEGNPSSAEVRQLSSSIPTFAIVAALPVMSLLGDIVNKFLDAWKKTEEIRELRERVRKVGVSGEALEQFTEKIKETVAQVVEEAKATIAANSAINEAGRRNELTIAVGQDLTKLFAQIERGLVIEIRTSPSDQQPAPTSPDERATLANLRTLSQTLQFPEMNAEPILLEAGDPVEDGVVNIDETPQPTRRIRKPKSRPDPTD